MAFKIRDLLITDLDQAGGTQKRGKPTGRICGLWTLTLTLDFCPDPAEAYEQLTQLKAQLKQEIDQIEREQAVLEKQLTPYTLSQVEELELKVKAAVDELAKMKEELQKKPG